MQPITKNMLAEFKEKCYRYSVDYTIRKGDNLTRISEATGLPIVEIANQNNIENPNLIYEGDTLKLNFSGLFNKGKIYYPEMKDAYVRKQKELLYEMNEMGVSVWLQERK